MTSGIVVVVGDIMVDILIRLAGPLRRGTDQTAEIVSLPGGSGANQAVWLASAGVPVRLAARVGAADRAGLSAALQRTGVAAHLSADPDAPTGTLVCLVDPDAERSFLTSRGANAALSRADLGDDLLEGAALLHISGYALFAPAARAGVADLLATARARGVATSVDPGSSGFLADLGPETFLAATAGIDTIIPNADEAAILTGASEPKPQIARLLDAYPVVVLKRGLLGAIAATRDGTRVSRPAAPADVVDTTGAGDAFLAGWVAARLSGADLGAALDAATTTAAKAVSRLGGRP